MSNAEQQIEQEIQDKGLNAPRLTPEHIDATISSVNYFTADDGVVGRAYQNKEVLFNPGVLSTLTFCVIVLKNGFTVTGESACASPENFDAEIGRKIAYENAREKIWPLEGYLLKERLYQQQDTTDIGIVLASTSEPPMQTQVVDGSLNPLNPENFTQYVGTKELLAMRMTRAEWCKYRGWQVPPNENGNDDGYMVQYLDGGKPNHPDHSFYISWSPKDVFERTYHAVDGEPPVPTAVNCGESSGSVGEAKSCSGNVSYGNHRTIELLLEILRGTNVGSDVSDKARAKLSQLVDKI